MSPDDWTPERHAAALARCKKATPGEWHAADCVSPKIAIYAWTVREGESRPTAHYLGECYADVKGQGRANMSFIADARTDLPAALREIERLNKRLNHAHDAANKLYCAAVAVNQQLRDFGECPAYVANELAAAIDPAEAEASAVEIARRDGLEAEIERARTIIADLEAKLARCHHPGRAYAD